MAIALSLLVVSMLAVIAYQDFRYREVLVWYFVILFVASLPLVTKAVDFKTLLVNSIVNVCIVTFQLVVLTLYFSLKNKTVTNIFNNYLGVGDIVFFLVCCVWFSPMNFVCFFLAALVTSLLIQSVLRFKTIPLAGIMAVMLVLVVGMSTFASIDFQSDVFLCNIMSL